MVQLKGAESSAETNILFNELYKHKETIEGAPGLPLSWESPEDLQTEAGRIVVYKEGTISDSVEYVEELADWSTDMAIRLYSCFTGYFSKL